MICKAIYGLIITVLFLACVDHPREFEETPALQFNATIRLNSRSSETVTDVAYPIDTPFGIFAFALPNDQTWKKYATTATLFLDNNKVTWHDGAFSTDSPCYWPSGKQLLTFFAYSPTTLKATCTPEQGIEVNNYQLQDSVIDFMFTEPITDLSAKHAGGTVNITFTHALCLVDFLIQTPVPQEVTLHLKRLSLDSVYQVGSFHSQPFPTWTGEGNPEEQVIFEGDLPLNDLAQATGEPQWVIPQRVETKLKAVCDIISGKSILPNQQFETQAKLLWGTGKRCSYTLKLSLDTLTFTTDILKK